MELIHQAVSLSDRPMKIMQVAVSWRVKHMRFLQIVGDELYVVLQLAVEARL